MISETLSAKDRRVFAQQIELAGVGAEGQLKIKKSRVFIAGAGGKGISAMRNLLSAGVIHMGIADDQTITEELLPRQSLYGYGELGQPRAIVARKKLMAIHTQLDCEVYNTRLTESNAKEILKKYELVVDATNNHQAHEVIFESAEKLGLHVVFGEIDRNRIKIGIATPFISKRYNDLYTPGTSEEASDEGLAGSGIRFDLCGLLMANEALKLIIGMPSPLRENDLIFSMEQLTGTLHRVKSGDITG